MLKYVTYLASRAQDLLEEEGLGGLVHGVGRFARMSVRRVARVGDFYVYRYPIPVTDPEAHRPRVEGFEVRVIESMADLSALREAGYEDPCRKVRSLPRRLKARAVAVCGFASRRLAYIGWVATSYDAKMSFDPLPYHVDFAHGEAATGGAWTVPAYRGRGLYRYMFGRELDYLRRNGRTICCNAIGTNNEASQRGQAVYGAETYARARLVRVLAFSRWTEHPVAATFTESVPGSPQTQRTDAASVSGQ